MKRMSDTQAWIIKVIALGVSLALVLWAISVLRHGPSLNSELPTEPIPAKVQTGH